MTLQEKLQEIIDMADAASPGPFKKRRVLRGDDPPSHFISDKHGNWLCKMWPHKMKENQNFLVASRENVPQLAKALMVACKILCGDVAASKIAKEQALKEIQKIMGTK